MQPRLSTPDFRGAEKQARIATPPLDWIFVFSPPQALAAGYIHSADKYTNRSENRRGSVKNPFFTLLTGGRLGRTTTATMTIHFVVVAVCSLPVLQSTTAPVEANPATLNPIVFSTRWCDYAKQCKVPSQAVFLARAQAQGRMDQSSLCDLRDNCCINWLCPSDKLSIEAVEVLSVDGVRIECKSCTGQIPAVRIEL